MGRSELMRKQAARRKKKDDKEKSTTNVNPGGKGIGNTRLTDNKESRKAALNIKKGLGTAWKSVKNTVKSINEQQARDKARRKKEGIGEYATRDGSTYKANPGGKGIPNTTSKKTKKGTDTGGTSDSDKAAWLKRTRNSPAAKSGAWKNDPEGRWAIQKAVRERKAAKLKIQQYKKKKKGG